MSQENVLPFYFLENLFKIVNVSFLKCFENLLVETSGTKKIL